MRKKIVNALWTKVTGQKNRPTDQYLASTELKLKLKNSSINSFRNARRNL